MVNLRGAAACQRTTPVQFIYLSLIFCIVVVPVLTFCKFTNLNCQSYIPEALIFEKCLIKAVSPNDNYLSIYVKMLQVVRKALVRITLLKRANGWKPFLYDITFDGCRFMKNHKINPIANFFFDVLAEFTNLNHTCPYAHDVFLEKFRILNGTVRLPFPLGDYAVDTQWTVNNKMWARVNGSCSYYKD